jgi:hypothetical protein
VRALDEEHVYVRVSWLNRPGDLEGGRKDHHGKNELVPTNQMDIINAQSVNGTFRLVRYDRLKYDDRNNAYNQDEYFWKQTFDFATKMLVVFKATIELRSDRTHRLTRSQTSRDMHL